MATVTRKFTVPPAAVWDVLADGWRYSNWVVGTSHMRAVDPDWPRAGSRLDHASGIWPLVVRDDTVVVASEPPVSLELVAHGGPLGDAAIRITVTGAAAGCVVVMTEIPVSGPGRWFHNPAFAALIRARNTEALVGSPRSPNTVVRRRSKHRDREPRAGPKAFGRGSSGATICGRKYPVSTIDTTAGVPLGDPADEPIAGATVDPADDTVWAWGVLDRLGRDLHVKEARLPATLDAILRTAIDIVAPATAAGVNLYVRGRFEPQAVLGAPPHRLDAWQQEHGEGPCIEASRDQVTVQVDDTGTEPRWAGFGALAAELGVGSMLCVPLWVDDARLGSVSLYADAAAAFSRHDERIAALLATQASLALADAHRTEQLRTMAANRDLIGQAKGVLMERHKITADQAFDRLRTASQDSNRKLVDVADAVVTTGSLG